MRQMVDSRDMGKITEIEEWANKFISLCCPKIINVYVPFMIVYNRQRKWRKGTAAEVQMNNHFITQCYAKVQ
jgi:hypothetical protein